MPIESEVEEHSTRLGALSKQAGMALKGLSVLASTDSIPSLIAGLEDILHSVVQFQKLTITLRDAESGAFWLFCRDGVNQLDQGVKLDDLPCKCTWESQESKVCEVSTLSSQFPGIMGLPSWQDCQSYCAVPLGTSRRSLGALEVVSKVAGAFGDEEVRFIQVLAGQAALLVENLWNLQEATKFMQKLARERDHVRTLLKVTNAVVSKLEMRELNEEISRVTREVLGNEVCSLALHDPVTNKMRWEAVEFPHGEGPALVGRTSSAEDRDPSTIAFNTKTTCVVTRSDLAQLPDDSPGMAVLLGAGVETSCSVPLVAHGKVLGVFNVARVFNRPFEREEIALVEEIAGQVSIAVANALAYQEITRLKDKVTSEKLYLEEEIRSEHNFEDLIGESAGLKRVLAQAEMVADCDSTVLLLGETGTGKELIARAIHNLSRRRDRTLVKLNCAAIPTGLLESELFGHEKGAFTGAISQKVGRFELAHQGTLFLDEVGDIPLELQPKLLRALQEREFERLGGTRVVHVNVRLIAATNRNLGRMIADQQFRSDLYYRLNVFPIVIPPLRQRPEDIPMLVRYFAQKYARRMNRTIDCIPAESMRILTRLPWYGNVRELENVIERAVILSRGTALNVPITELQHDLGVQFSSTGRAGDSGSPERSKDTERDKILRALRETNGTVSGPRGAAMRLGMKRTTLLSKMERLGISARDLT
jgi:formate hydrogenlyase transcriptional activator